MKQNSIKKNGIKPEIYTHFFETITVKTPLTEYANIYAQNAFFKDPFHQINGVEKIYDIFQNMYKNLENPHFKIIETATNPIHLFVVWEFHFVFRGRADSFKGMSQLTLDSQGKINSHIDFWDAGEHIYAKIPILGWFINYVKNKIAN